MFRKYFHIEIKRTGKLIGRMLFGALLSLAAVCIVCFACSTIVSQNQKKKSSVKADIALCIDHEGNNKAAMAMNFVQSIDSIKNICRFHEMNLDAAYDQLKKKEVMAIIHIPDEFVEGVMDGRNLPATIIYRKGASVTEDLFRMLTKSGADDLAAAQAGVYVVQDYCDKLGITGQERDRITREINVAYLNRVLSREEAFTSQTQTVTGKMNVAEYYLTGGLIFFFLLSGIGFSRLYYGEPKEFVWSCKRKGIGLTGQLCVKGICTFLIYFLAGMILVGILSVSGPTDLSARLLSAEGALILVAIAAMAASFVLLCYSLAKDEVRGIVLLLCLSVCMLFVSGGCIPAGYLPVWMGRLSQWMPFAHAWNMLEAFFLKESVVRSAVSVFLFALAFLLIGCVAEQRRYRKAGR